MSVYRYQDIICWGSTKDLFQFKLFGGVMGRTDPVAVVFGTVHGKTLEKVKAGAKLVGGGCKVGCPCARTRSFTLTCAPVSKTRPSAHTVLRRVPCAWIAFWRVFA